MKKSVIKRRKRVIPMPEGDHESVDSPSPPRDPSTERGSVNSDGSVHLGGRRQQDPLSALVPEAELRHLGPSTPQFSGDLNQYHTSHNSQPHQVPSSLTDENRLAPLNLIDASGEESSLAPSSFLSPSRKRPFSAIEPGAPHGEQEDPKRLSSIKSILNMVDSPTDVLLEPNRQPIRSPGSTVLSVPSPGSLSYNETVGTPNSMFSGQNNAKDLNSEGEKAKAERRLALQREADRMRKMLADKERELAELD